MSTPTFEPFAPPEPSEATAWSPGEGVPIPGPEGPQGPAGPANTLTIGTVTAGVTPAATITGTAPNQVLNLQLPQGNPGSTGAPGSASSLSIGTVTTVAAGGSATATITGTPPNQSLNLGIPAGASGPVGPAGPGGNLIYQGNGAPSNSLGILGDYYIDAVGLNWWGPKGPSIWPATPAFSLVPPAGLPRRSVLTRTSDQAVGAWPTMINWQASANLNVSGVWSSGNPSRIVVPAGISYAQITAQVEVNGGATAGTLLLEIYKNGVQISPRVKNNSGRNTTSGSAENILVVSSYAIPVVPGDYLEVRADQASLSASSILFASLWAQVTFS